MDDPRSHTPSSQPAHHAEPSLKPSPISGVSPPVHTRWQPGQSGNPQGRPSLGAAVLEELYELARREPSVDELREIARTAKTANKRAAAERYLRMAAPPDLADFEDLINGSVGIEELKSRGVDTTAIKKFRRRTTSGDGGPVTTTEIELHDWSGQEFDRLLDRTQGKPHQKREVEHSGAVGGALLRVDLSEDAMRRIEAGNKRSGGEADQPQADSKHDPRLAAS